jgi:hypothetical protein
MPFSVAVAAPSCPLMSDEIDSEQPIPDPMIARDATDRAILVNMIRLCAMTKQEGSQHFFVH